MVTKITLSISLTETFYKTPEKDTLSSFEDIKVGFNCITEDLTKAQTVATLIASGNFDVTSVLQTFYLKSQITTTFDDLNATTYQVPNLTIFVEEVEEAFEWEIVRFEDVGYKCRVIPDLHNDGCSLTIAPQSLNRIIDHNTSKSWLTIDGTICYYASPEEMILSDEELFKTIYGT